ncbi:isochorismatase domain-containing protein 2A [Ophiocordyceps camponoti-floridani]|uniref:Isochorismatase domain-containing protein 2A n=1 Tax=Ophiocordyceps camponoti-floridani TaxID=2030778 RepID=A0A8H4VDL9_9HYPO|nr:isochorismatase domain-containing protein 2A [Ophiocordyceps camponoti-floridani]
MQRPATTTTTTTTKLLRTMTTTTTTTTSFPRMRFENPAVLVCDMQEKFRPAIHEFDSIVTTAEKLLKYARSLPTPIPIHATTQTRSKLGPTVPSIAELLPHPPHDKTRFSMVTTQLASSLAAKSSVALVGIEAHICITQTALDLRDAGHVPYVLADGVGSCNAWEVGVALERLRAERGVVVTSSESWMFECLGDAAHEGFGALFGVVKGAVGDTKRVLERLGGGGNR